jgi:DNA recombination protein RmuC
MSQQLLTIIALSAVSVIAIVIVVVFIVRRGTSRTSPDVLIQLEQVRSDLRDLSELFLVPQRRGSVGETLLSELLQSWLPPRGFELQYGFPNGTRADAVIKLGSRLVVVDSKYPQEAVTRSSTGTISADVRKAVGRHVADIARKYIQPEAGTMSFALMYVPSERIYVELFAGNDATLMQQALESNVVPVSPSTLFVYVQTVAYGLRGLALSERAGRLVGNVERLQNQLSGFKKRFELAQTHLRNLTRALDDSSVQLTQVERAAEHLLPEEEETR